MNGNESLADMQKKRRQRRKEILRNKRLKSHCNTSSNVCAISDFISGSSIASQTSSINSTIVMSQEETEAIIESASQTMSAQELRKLKNRLSAERSRQRKIQLIETLTIQVFECALQYNDLLEENKTLKLQQSYCVSDGVVNNNTSGLSLSSFSLLPATTTTSNNNNISSDAYHNNNNMEISSKVTNSDHQFNYSDHFDLDSNEVSELLDELLQ